MTYGNLLHLVFSDIDDAGIRAELIAHLRTAAEGVTSRPIRILSDIDDTLFSKYHDGRVPEGTPYPGVRAFYAELAAASGTEPLTEPFVTFISARPADRGGRVEEYTLDQLRDLGFESATLLAGSFARVHSHEAMAEGKRHNLARYRALYPELRFVFVGDSGQGDVAFGESILADYPDDVVAVFIHDLVNVEEELGPTPEGEKAAAAGRRLYYFDDYADAARIAASIGLLSKAAVTRIRRSG